MTIFVKSFWVLSALHSCWFSQELSELDYPWNLKVLPNVGSWFWFHGGFPQTIHLYEVNAMNLHYPRDMTENLKAIEERIDEYSSVSEVTPWFKKKPHLVTWGWVVDFVEEKYSIQKNIWTFFKNHFFKCLFWVSKINDSQFKLKESISTFWFWYIQSTSDSVFIGDFLHLTVSGSNISKSQGHQCSTVSQSDAELQRLCVWNANGSELSLFDNQPHSNFKKNTGIT